MKKDIIRKLFNILPLLGMVGCGAASAQIRPQIKAPPPVVDIGPPKSTRVCEGAEIHPDSKYVVDIAAGTVLDKSTNLMWTRCALGLSGKYCEQYSEDNPLKTAHNENTVKWGHTKAQLFTSHAAEMAAEKNARFAGLEGWRLPTVKEFDTLREKTCSNPSMNDRVFPTGQYGTAHGVISFHTSDRSHQGYNIHHYAFAYGSAFKSYPAAERVESMSGSNTVRLVRQNK